jgi:VWFA-related protein
VLVDAVVTDKKGYIRDLKAKDFHVLEDNKEQTVNSFSYEADPASGKSQRHYIILFFDNSHMAFDDQPRARRAAEKFIDSTAGPNRMMGVVNFNGTMQLAMNFTDNADRLKKVVSGAKPDLIGLNETEAEAAPELQNAASSFGARTAFLALRSLAEGLRTVPGRKTLIYLSADFKLPPDRTELNAAVDSCHRANVAIYSLDIRGLVAIAGLTPSARPENALASGRRALLRLAAFASRAASSGPGAAFAFQGPGAPSGNVNTGDWSSPQNQAHLEMKKVPDSLLSQDALLVLSDETGGFAIHNTNDLAGGLEKIGQEQSEYYLLGYTPPESSEGSCHKLRVKVDRGGSTVRARAEYCVEKSHDLLAGSPIEKELEDRVAAASPSGNGAAFMEAPFFYSSPKVARVSLAVEMPSDKLKAE